MTRYLDTEDLVALIRLTGAPVAIRDVGLLESAAARPRASVFGEEAYPDLHTKAAALLESIVRNHPLVDGNKRLGWLAIATCYRLNSHRLRVDDDSGYDLVIAVAEGRLDVATIAGTLAPWVRSN
ncbi:type II toxin-antitoxin system death-on-curing family toxin [Sporichthya polymorpha]|uniref:type II toxin-antitoxin system death-on-curing family toxin n=1 Tax=Sporichthya polymorpha TaxID=35751 RepID=UPI00036F92D2|nr:Fic family protein [Sporichthya polymorpha]